MAEQKTERRGGSLAAYILTPFLLLLLTGGILVLCYSAAPAHRLQKYLNIAFMDNLKTSSKTAGLRIIEKEIRTDQPVTETYENGAIDYPVFGEQYAKLVAEDAGINVGVFYGSNAELLERGACQSTQSAIIGTKGNIVIDAHVNTYFADLTKLVMGVPVVLYTDYGVFTYRVSEQISFDKSDKKYLAVTDEDYLTLYTCQPELLGNSDLRVGVRCELVSKEFYRPAEQS